MDERENEKDDHSTDASAPAASGIRHGGECASGRNKQCLGGGRNQRGQGHGSFA